MAISFTCSACDSEVRVKSDLAGRKIKCPSCKESIIVPDEDESEAVTAAAPRKAVAKKPSRAAEDDEDDQEEPKKAKKSAGKKKKKSSNAGLIIGLAVGGGVLLLAIVGGLLLFLPGRGNPQAQNTNKQAPPVDKKDPPKVEKKEPVKKEDNKLPPKENVSALGRQRDLIEYRNYFNQVGLAYAQIVTETNRPPKSKEDFLPYLQGAQKLIERLNEGHIQVIYNVHPDQMPDGASNTIVGYEPYFDTNGRRLVFMGNGKVREMDSNEYLQTPKAKGP